MGTRRRFLSDASRVSLGFCGLKAWENRVAEAAPTSVHPYGELIADPQGILSLPRGFQYKIVSRYFETMDDGLFVPHMPDGMATFPGPQGLTIIVRNHEHDPEHSGPYGKGRALVPLVDRSKLYDAEEGKTACPGGTTTIVYDTQNQRVVRQFLSLGGTIRNCAGGPTPWKSWITCEETEDRAGCYEETGVTLGKDHGYNFEVPASAQMKLHPAIPLKDMGRFRHEAVAVDPETSIVYQTEDTDDGLIYRFIPRRPGRLMEGGRLQALHVRETPSLDTRNWEVTEVEVGQKLDVVWRDLEDVTAPDNDLRLRGFAAGAARFARGEGMWRGDQGEIYFAATSGGRAQTGQIWRYRPAAQEGQEGTDDFGQLELFIESGSPGLVENADNLTMAPWGDLVVCEDRDGDVVRIVGVSPEGGRYVLGMNHTNTELAGACFSPDGSTLFVNIQDRALTLAITGPWLAEG